MMTRTWTRSLATVAALAIALMAQPAIAADVTDRSVLEGVAKDLRLTLSSRPSEPEIRLPLNPAGWSFLGRLRPYALLGPQVITEIDDVAGLAAPIREPGDALSKGVGVGAGFSWHLSDRLEFFGQYQFFNIRGLGGQADNAFGRHEVESPTLKGGFSIRF